MFISIWLLLYSHLSAIFSSSTLENWVREFQKFAPSMIVQTYYAGKEERPLLRATLQDTMRTKNKDGWEVLITTYNLAQGDDKDRKFFRYVIKIGIRGCDIEERPV
jgi:SWI/SNF-related matrix-associated actin-dependent regulator 1 of chromatin subfamily A